MADRVVTDGISIREMRGRAGSESSNQAAISRTFLCRGSDDPLRCRDALEANASTLQLFKFAGLTIDSYEWDASSGSDAWEFTYNYSRAPEVGGYNISIDSTGETVLVTEAYAQTKYNASGLTGPDFGKSINVQEGKAEGVQRVIPSLKLNVDARISREFIDTPIGYSKVVAGLTGFVNSTPYLTFAAGELLFLGASGAVVGEDPRLNFSFLASPNLSGWTIGDITGISKKGHDYIWFNYRTLQDGTTGLKVAKARAAYVARIYGEADFSVLKIGET